MRVAVTGSGGRLGTSLVRCLRERGFADEVLAWDLPEHDLDDPACAERLVSTFRPDVVVHSAAWTDVDGCARNPELAMRRNGTAVGEMAEACAQAGAAMVMVSTNEVFDGRRTDGGAYLPADPASPGNPYGAAKLAGELAARAAFIINGAPAPLAIVRTAWLFGLPGADFPRKIVAAAEKARAAGETLSLVSDEIGCPTYAPDLAAAIVSLVEEWARPHGNTMDGIHHIVNAGRASRAEWARDVLRLAGIHVPTREVPLTTWPRPSTPPSWGVLEPTPLPGGPLRPWQAALSEYMKLLAATAAGAPEEAGR